MLNFLVPRTRYEYARHSNKWRCYNAMTTDLTIRLRPCTTYTVSETRITSQKSVPFTAIITKYFYTTTSSHCHLFWNISQVLAYGWETSSSVIWRLTQRVRKAGGHIWWETKPQRKNARNCSRMLETVLWRRTNQLQVTRCTGIKVASTDPSPQQTADGRRETRPTTCVRIRNTEARSC